ncbi:MAG: cystathionine gamma-synthase [Polyangiales bacterium]
MKSDPLRFDTLAIHAAQEPDDRTGAVMTPIVLSSTFAHASLGQPRGYEYSRSNNPTRETLERCLAALEGGAHGLAFASGCAAMACVFQTLRPGDHVVASVDVYGGTFRLLDKVFGPIGVQTSWVDMRDPRNVREAINPRTKWVWAESPSNPTLSILDLAAIAEVAHQGGALFGVDNTFATPALQRPLALGADLVVHSTTKYLNGHSDVVGGAVVLDDAELAQRLRFLQNAVGAVPSPFDCFLVLRGVKTLPVRMARHGSSAQAVAQHLLAHPKVETVLYPGLPSHPGHAVAGRQMSGFGGMASFVVKGGEEAARAVLGATRLFTLAESLGGVESLIEHPASMTHASMPRDVRERIGVVDGLVRLSVGLEDPADLIDDLDRALAGA